MYYKNNSFLVYGMEKSGLAVVKGLKERGGTVYCYDDNPNKLAKYDKEIKKLGGIPVDFKWCNENIEKIYVLVISPGVPIDSKLCLKAKKFGVRIIGELEFALQNTNFPMVAVTGTNGKTTTVNLISAILTNSDIDNFLAGNVGIPLSEKIGQNPDKIAVTEVSSFQMETTNSICPHIGVVLNISPNHLDRHYNMDYYIYLKNKILLNCKESEFAVLNYDDEIVKGFAEGLKAKIVWFSTLNKVDGCYVKDGEVFFKDKPVIKVNDIKLKGAHNLYDVLAAIAVCKLLNVDNSAIKKAVGNYSGEKHRIEFVKQVGGVEYYDDSKSTNTASTIAAIKSFDKNIILILGGKSKGEDFANLIKALKNSNVRQIILCGETRFDILSAATGLGYNALTLCSSFQSAVEVACVTAKKGEVVLLSPACSSKDEFINFEERGDRFKEIVGRFNEKEKFKDKK